MEQTTDNVNTLIAAYIPDSAAKKVTDADRKFIHAHLSSALIEQENVQLALGEVSVTNPFTGTKVVATPLVTSLVKMVQELSYNEFGEHTLKHYNLTRGNAVQKFDRARMLALKIDSNTYMQILD